MQDNNGNVNLEDVSSSGRPFLRSGSYAVRCLSCEKSKSKKGNDMLVLKYEIVAPEMVAVVTDKGEVQQKITGLQLTDWIVLGDTGFPRLKGLHKALGLPMSVNVKSPDTKQYVGKAVKVTLSTETSVEKDQNTGEPIIDETTGQPATVNNYRIQRFLGADTEHTIPADSVAF